MTPQRCKDCDRDMEEDRSGRPRCFACDDYMPTVYSDGEPEHVVGKRREDTREGLKRPVKS